MTISLSVSCLCVYFLCVVDSHENGDLCNDQRNVGLQFNVEIFLVLDHKYEKLLSETMSASSNS